jgi:NAD+ synthase (glutamine-hydrolysing)
MLSLNQINYCRISLVSPEIRIANPVFNTNQIIKYTKEAIYQNSHIVLFSELSITGYSCGDLFFNKTLLDESLNSLIKLVEFSKDNDIIIIVGLPLAHNDKLYNCAAVIQNNKILGIVPKTYLCNYNEYYEKRWFNSSLENDKDNIIINNDIVPFGANIIFNEKNDKFSFAVEICEDLWAVKPPSLDYALEGAQIILNLSSSNDYLSKYEYRKELIKIHSTKIIGAYLYASSSLYESVSDTIFSGHCISYENGKLIDESSRFNLNTNILTVDIDYEYLKNERIKNKTFSTLNSEKNLQKVIFCLSDKKVNNYFRNFSKLPFVPTNPEQKSKVCEEIINLQSYSLIRRILHTKSDSLVIGISGGLDSTLALLVSINVFNILEKNLKNIYAVSMPGFGTSTETENYSEELAKLLKINFKKIDITTACNTIFKDIEQKNNQFDVVFENTQARYRTLLLMNLANKYNGLVVGTGDLSEIALGWNTYNGDHMSMYGVNAGIPKTLVKYLIEWFAEKKYSGEISSILKKILELPITPELLPKNKDGKIIQKTEEIIGPYVLHDFFLYYFFRMSFNSKKILHLAYYIFKDDFSKKEIKKWFGVFIKRFFTNQFKRNAMPDGIKIGTVSLSPRTDWRMPSEADFEIWINNI